MKQQIRGFINEIRMCLAELLMDIQLRLAPIETEDGRRLIWFIQTYSQETKKVMLERHN